MANTIEKYCDIAYSFLIGGDGKVYEGRGWDEIGAHTLGFNSKVIVLSLFLSFNLFSLFGSRAMEFVSLVNLHLAFLQQQLRQHSSSWQNAWSIKERYEKRSAN